MTKGWLIGVVALLAVGCSERYVGAAVADTPIAEWSAEEDVVLHYTNSDTLSLYNLSVVARRKASFSKEVLPMTVEVQTPSGVRYGGEVVLVPTHRHLGGSFVELAAEWVEDALLAEEGDYLFTVAPCRPTDGVWNVGIRLVN